MFVNYVGPPGEGKRKEKEEVRIYPTTLLSNPIQITQQNSKRSYAFLFLVLAVLVRLHLHLDERRTRPFLFQRPILPGEAEK